MGVLGSEDTAHLRRAPDDNLILDDFGTTATQTWGDDWY